MTKAHNIKEETNNVYGFLTVLFKSDRKDKDCALWFCRCICGTLKEYKGTSLRKGLVKSCGCKKGQFTSIKLQKADAGLNRAYGNYKRAAAKRGYEFNLSKEDFKILIVQPCYYCGTIKSNRIKLKNVNFEYNGIDRINNSLGYSKENIVTCCSLCNWLKNDLKLNDFLDHIVKIYHYRVNNG